MPGLKILDILEKEEVVVKDKTKKRRKLKHHYPFDVQTGLNWPDLVFYSVERQSILLCLTPDEFYSSVGNPWESMG